MVSQGLFHGKKLEKAPVYGEEKYWEHKSFSDTENDGEKFNRLIEEAVAKLDNEGFKVISVTPVVSGKYSYGAMIEGGYGFGYSYTSGVTILAQKP